MAKYQYKCVNVPEIVKIGKKDFHSKVVTEYEKIINAEAADGWEYVGIDTIESYFESGCLAKIPIIGAFFRGDEAVSLKLIIFRKSV